jgi:pyruvate formate lyase activating enzyme
MTVPLIADLKRNSLDDGPGIRTTVFFKGCPLSCVWCQNPEAKSFERQLMYERSSCLRCGECVAVCPQNAIDFQRDGYPVDTTSCVLCGQCIRVCPSEALRFVGSSYSVEELCAKLLKDEVFFKNSGGGVTLSGGEATARIDYVAELAKALKMRGVHICLETGGFYDGGMFKNKLLPFLDLIYFDIKIFDRAAHIQYCGAPNDVILENFKNLIHEGIPILPRIPLIPGITSKPENLEAIRIFLKSCGVTEIGLLPYNPLWLSKPETLGIVPDYTCSTWMTQEERKNIQEIFSDFSFKPF